MIQRLFLTILIDNLLLHLGEDNVDLLLEILTECSGLQKSNSQSSDSLDSLFDDKDASNPPEYSTFVEPKEEPDLSGIYDDKRSSLLKMNFSVEEVDFAMEKLGT
ncbi:probable inactive DNA (cytosine-5)-methyltransferase DRM3 isoform X3 [Jatropha curcas]|uniref:probable inactive DNA (cytosine-5)-methyltransferase DRM3 isoform X3 n=1 Tax=Jatropha curcas TaxID=180498 RepID=UPI001895341A|nr:probable inactive DNA (cytosine-5)-methyltransferase DRM3 isoform X3 [Jatropha curcas]